MRCSADSVLMRLIPCRTQLELPFKLSDYAKSLGGNNLQTMYRFKIECGGNFKFLSLSLSLCAHMHASVSKAEMRNETRLRNMVGHREQS